MSSNTYKQILEKGKQILRENSIDDYDIDAFLLMEFVFDVNKSYYFLHMNDKADENRAKEYYELIRKRAEHIPLQHITGTQEFMDCVFEVNEHVLIPRQDTEVLVEKAIESIQEILRKKKLEKVRVLDMCTGSGCIAVSICKILSEKGIKAEVTAIDISEEALKVAEKNNIKNNTNVLFLKSNLFENINSEKFDIIISNPPYIEKKVIPTLMEEVKEHEPLLALDGGIDGLDFYREIIKDAKKQNHDFIILFEIGYDQGEKLKKIFAENNYENIEIYKDLAGLERVARADYKK